MATYKGRMMKQLIIDWLLMLAAILILIIVLVTHARSEDSPEYLRAKAAAAIAIYATTDTPEPNPWFPPSPPVKPEPKPKTAGKPVVLMFYAPFHCPPCLVQQADVKGWTDAPFDIQTPAKCPVQIPFYPFTVWQDASGKWRYLEQWGGRKDLLERWRATQGKQARAPPVNHWPAMTGYRPRWTWPGDLRQHLRTVHGITEPLTQDQAEALHDALHEGYSIHSIKQRLGR